MLTKMICTHNYGSRVLFVCLCPALANDLKQAPARTKIGVHTGNVWIKYINYLGGRCPKLIMLKGNVTITCMKQISGNFKELLETKQ